jgi:hypothetical protein
MRVSPQECSHSVIMFCEFSRRGWGGGASYAHRIKIRTYDGHSHLGGHCNQCPDHGNHGLVFCGSQMCLCIFGGQ